MDINAARNIGGIASTRFFILLGICRSVIVYSQSSNGAERRYQAAQEEEKEKSQWYSESPYRTFCGRLSGHCAEATVLVKWAKDMPEVFPFGVTAIMTKLLKYDILNINLPLKHGDGF